MEGKSVDKSPLDSIDDDLSNNPIEITRDAMIKVSNKLFEADGLTSFIIDGYNDFICRGIRDIVESNPVIFSRGRVEFTDPYVMAPTMYDQTIDNTILFPHEAEERKLDYAGQLLLTMKCYVDGIEDPVVIKKKAFCMNVLIMTGSCKDQLIVQRIPKDKWINKKACDRDPQCYFIVKGAEKALVTQEKLAVNNMFVIMKPKNNDKERMICEMRCLALNKSIYAIYVTMNETTQTGTKRLVREVICNLPFMKEKEINVCNLIRVYTLVALLQPDLEEDESIDLSGSSFEQAKDLLESVILNCTDNKKMQMIAMNFIETTIEEAQLLGDDSNFVKYLSTNFNLVGDTQEDKLLYLKEKLDKEFFANLDSADISAKITTLGMMIYQYMLTYKGYRPIDDRDHYGIKRLEGPGPLYQSLFNKVFQLLTESLGKILDSAVSSGNSKPSNLFNGLEGQLKSNGTRLYNDHILHSFSTGLWGIKGKSPRAGVSQALSRLSLLATYANIRKVGIPAKKTSKHSKPRQLHETQWGIMCPSDTPEGDACGLNKQFAISVYVTYDKPADSIYNFVLDYIEEEKGSNLKVNDDLIADVPVFVNGGLIGYSNGDFLYYLLKKAKRSRELFFDTGITLKSQVTPFETIRILKISTTGGRCCRPLAVIDDKANKEGIRELVMYKKGLLEEYFINKSSFDDYLNEGAIEYLDVDEIENTLIAIGPEHLLNGNPYTHCELNPTFILGVVAATMPFPQHNPNPRVTYYTAMAKQTVSVPISTYQHRADTNMKILHYGQAPVVKTDMGKIVGIDVSGKKREEGLPAGQNLVVLVQARPEDQEDAIIVNRASIDRDLFSSDTYHIFQTTISKSKSGQQEFADLGNSDKYNKLYKGMAKPREKVIEKDGKAIFVGNNVVFNPRDVLLAKTRMEKGEEIDDSLILTGTRSGVIDKIFMKDNHKIERIVKFKIRFFNRPGEGDKLASRFSQKGVIGRLEEPENLPFTHDGMQPDIVINPHAFPSRMTLGQILEMFIGKGAVSYDINKDLANFVKYSMKTKRYEIKHDIYLPVWKLLKEDLADKKLAVAQLFLTNLKKDENFIADHPFDLEDNEVVINYRKLLKEQQAYDKDSVKHKNTFNPTQRVDHKYDNYYRLLTIVRGLKRTYLQENKNKEYTDSELDDIINKITKVDISVENVLLDLLFQKDLKFDLIDDFKNYYSNFSPDSVALKFLKNKYEDLYPDIWEIINPELLDVLIDIEEAQWKINMEEKVPRVRLSEFSELYREQYIQKHLSDVVPTRDIVDPKLRAEFQKRDEKRMNKFTNGTAFNEKYTNDIEDTFRRSGFEPLGNVATYSGITGDLMMDNIYNENYEVVGQKPTDMFWGIAYYSALKHMVKDKIHARDTGKVQLMNRQATEGRSKDGGIRFGEMERDSVLAHGATHFLKERLKDVSDPFESYVCGCGSFCYIDIQARQYVCESCDNPTPYSITIPYSLKLIRQDLAAMLVGMKTGFKYVDQYNPFVKYEDKRGVHSHSTSNYNTLKIRSKTRTVAEAVKLDFPDSDLLPVYNTQNFQLQEGYYHDEHENYDQEETDNDFYDIDD